MSNNIPSAPACGVYASQLIRDARCCSNYGDLLLRHRALSDKTSVQDIEPYHNFVVIAPMIMKLGTGVKPDVFYTMVSKNFMTPLLLRHYDVITCILANAWT